MTTSLPKVSIIIPCWNAEAYVADAIGSCLDQRHPNLEVIVVNDGSTDRSQDVIDRFKGQVVSISVPNGGANKARNIGLRAAAGQYMMFLDADDYVQGELIPSLVHEMKSKRAEIGFSPWVKQRNGVDLGDTALQKQRNWNELLVAWLLGEYTPTCSVLWAKALISGIGGWDERLSKNQDGDVVIRGLLQRPALAFSQEGRGVYRQHEGIYRVSNANASASHNSQSIIYENLECWLSRNSDLEIKHSVGLFAYGLASLMYLRGERQFGAIWQQRAKSMGVVSASSTYIGVIAGRLFGLRYKTYIGAYLRRFR